MKTITIAALLVALATPALAQQKAEDHSAHHPAEAASAADMIEGEIRKVNKEAKKLTIKHGEIKSLDQRARQAQGRGQGPLRRPEVRHGLHGDRHPGCEVKRRAMAGALRPRAPVSILAGVAM